MEGIYSYIGYIRKLLKQTLNELSKKNNNLTLRFLINHNKLITNYLIEYKEIIIVDIKEQAILKENIKDITGYIQKISFEDSYDEIFEINYFIVAIHILNQMRKMTIFGQGEIASYDDIQMFNSGGAKFWFRGQNDYEHKLIPSYYRSLGKKDVLVDYNYLCNDYQDMQIENKINEVFGNSIIDYEKLSFIQHSLSMTPLLDFTKNPFSALSFAIDDYNNPRKMIESDAAIYLIDINDKKIITDFTEATNKIKNLRVEYIGSKPMIGTLIKSSFWIGFITGVINSEYYLIDIKTNDRMRIQDGTFVLFNNVLIVGDDMVVSSKKYKELSSIIKKIPIRLKLRLTIHNEIIKNKSKYHIQKMLNPYDFMRE